MSAAVVIPEKLLYTRNEAAVMLNISIRKLDYLIEDKVLPVRRIGTRVLVTRESLERFARGR
jgi:excisionase family DNA binding protein